LGSSALAAGLSLISPLRIAAFSAARSVARIRVSVAAETGDAQRLMLADDRGNHRLHLQRGQFREQHLPQVRTEIEADVRGVPADGRRRCGRA
jgi:hypothetical protein